MSIQNSLPIVQTNTMVQKEDNVLNTSIPSTSGYTWNYRPLTVPCIFFTISKELKVNLQGKEPIYYSMIDYLRC